MEQKKLSLGTKVGFGIGDIGGNAMFTIMAFSLQPFLIETLGLLPALAGTAVLIAKIWDAVIDPIIGPLSDRTRSRWGRRRPYLLVGGVFAFIALTVMFFNPRFDTGTQQTALFIWAVGIYCILCTAFSLFNIPYAAITPDLTDDFNQQTDLNATRMLFAVIGTLLAASVFPMVVNLVSPGEFVDKSQGYLVAGAIFGFLIMFFTLVTFISVREKPVEAKPGTSFFQLIASYLRVLKNGPYRIILFTYAINLIGTTIISSIMQIYFKYIFKAEGMFPIALLCLLGATAIFIPIWTPLIKRMGKNVSYAIGLFIMALATVFVFFLAPVLGMVFMFAMMGVAGIGLAATYTTPYAMIPDTIEYDQVRSGKREEGSYYGLWTFCSQIGQALAGFVSGIVLQLMNYIPAPIQKMAAGEKAVEIAQSPEALLGIRLLLGPIPAFFLILAGIFVLFYPINEKMYRDIMTQKKGG